MKCYRTYSGFPGGTNGKESACNAGDVKDAVSIPGRDRPQAKKPNKTEAILLQTRKNGPHKKKIFKKILSLLKMRGRKVKALIFENFLQVIVHDLVP